MKVVIATPLYPPEIGGPATHTVFMEKYLPQEGVEVDTVKFSSVRHLPKIVRHIVYTLKLFKAVRASDVLFAQDTVSVGFPASIVSSLTSTPMILRVPGDHAWEQAQARFGVTDSIEEFQIKRYGIRTEFLRFISRYVTRSADQVVVPSKYFASIVQTWMRDKSKLTVIYNGIAPIKSTEPTHMPNHPFAVSIGRLVPWKGFDTLIQAIGGLPDWKLVIIGDGPLRGDLEQMAQDTDVLDRVIFTGALSRAEVLGWLSASDAFVLNTSWESFSYQTVEAMMAGLPVIATNVCSIPELVEDDVEGVLVAPNDLYALKKAFVSVLDDRQLWAKRVAAGRVKAQFFSSDKTAAAIAALICGTANKPS